jgi:spermidine synthase
VYTDIYAADMIHPDVYTQEFVSQVYDLLDEGGLAVINSFRVPIEQIRGFAQSIQAPFGAVYIIEQYRKYFIVLAKTRDNAVLERFERRLPRYAQIDLRQIR